MKRLLTGERVYGYDAERDAELAIDAFLLENQAKGDVVQHELEKYVGWWWPQEKKSGLQLAKL